MTQQNLTGLSETEIEKDDGSRLMKAVEAIAISPQDARQLVNQYQRQVREKRPKLSDDKVLDLVVDKIISRYTKLATTSGAITSLPGTVPGVGTAISVVGGGVVDVSVCLKLQVDMVMCLAIAIQDGLSNEDAKHMSYYIALYGALEQMGSAGTTRIATKAGVRMVNRYLTGTTLLVIKELFKKIGIEFTKKAALKAIPFGIGVLVGGGANYALTKYIGKTARDTLLMRKEELGEDEIFDELNSSSVVSEESQSIKGAP